MPFLTKQFLHEGNTQKSRQKSHGNAHCKTIPRQRNNLCSFCRYKFANGTCQNNGQGQQKGKFNGILPFNFAKCQRANGGATSAKSGDCGKTLHCATQQRHPKWTRPQRFWLCMRQKRRQPQQNCSHNKPSQQQIFFPLSFQHKQTHWKSNHQRANGCKNYFMQLFVFKWVFKQMKYLY